MMLLGRERTDVRSSLSNVNAKTVKLPQVVPGSNLTVPNLWRSLPTTNPAKGKVKGSSLIDRRPILR